MRDPIAVVTGLDASASRHSTPCGEGKLVWREWGAGAPLLLLHGGHGSWTHWIRVIPELSRIYRVIVPDLPGLGESAAPPSPYTAESLAAIVGNGLREIAGAHADVSVAGFSFGGLIGGHLAAQRPDLVACLVLVGAGGLGLSRSRSLPMRTWRTIRDREQLLAAHRHNLGTLMIHDPAKIDALAVYLQAENTRRARLKSRPIAYTDTLARILATTGVPLAGIWGGCDATTGGHLADYETLLRKIRPSLAFHVIEGAGHWVAYEAPQTFVAMLIATLQAMSTSS